MNARCPDREGAHGRSESCSRAIAPQLRLRQRCQRASFGRCRGASRERQGVRRCVIVTDQSIAPIFEELERLFRRQDTSCCLLSFFHPRGRKELARHHELSNNLIERWLPANAFDRIGRRRRRRSDRLSRGVICAESTLCKCQRLCFQVDSSVGARRALTVLWEKTRLVFSPPRLVSLMFRRLDAFPAR